jgi:hypothetical protein
LLQTDVGSNVELGQVARGPRVPVAQATGTFGAGGSINMQVSNDGTNWMNAGNIAAANAHVALTVVGARFFRPSVSGGDGTTNIAVTVVW